MLISPFKSYIIYIGHVGLLYDVSSLTMNSLRIIGKQWTDETQT